MNKRLLYGLCSLVLIVANNNCTESNSNKHDITYEFISGEKGIFSFSIAKLDVQQLNNLGFPGTFTETDRVTCRLENGTKAKKIFFHKENAGYVWYKSSPNYDFENNDSLNKLSTSEILEFLKKEGVLKNAHKNRYLTIPFELESGNWYHLFGLNDIEGSYFIYVNKDRTFKTYYFDGGPY